MTSGSGMLAETRTPEDMFLFPQKILNTGNLGNLKFSHVSDSGKLILALHHSWHEMGVYDVPAVMDHILKTTGQPDLYYVGHSMGTTMFFVTVVPRRLTYQSESQFTF